MLLSRDYGLQSVLLPLLGGASIGDVGDLLGLLDRSLLDMRAVHGLQRVGGVVVVGKVQGQWNGLVWHVALSLLSVQCMTRAIIRLHRIAVPAAVNNGNLFLPARWRILTVGAELATTR